jgi:hypothetical protein
MTRFRRYGLLSAALFATCSVDPAAGADPSRNFVPYSGFDTGVYRLWRSTYQTGCVIDNADLDAGVRHDGPFSLRLRAYERGYANQTLGTEAESTFQVALAEAPQTYTLSVWARCDNPMQLLLSCGNLAIQAALNPEDGWRRLSATGTLQGAHSLKLSVQSSRLIPDELHGGQAWVDSIQLEKGAQATPWKPARLEAGLVTAPAFGIFHTNEPVRVAFRLSAPDDEPRDVRLAARLYGAFGETYPVSDPGDHVFTFPSTRTGVFRLEVEILNGGELGFAVADRRLEIPFYVLPKADPAGWNPIGLYAQMNRPTIELASRLNLFWNNLLSSAGELCEWHKVWRMGELWMPKYAHRLRWAAKNHHMRFIGNIGPSAMLERLPKDLLSVAPIPGETLSISQSPMTVERKHIKLEAFRTYLRTAAEAYRPYVKTWQIVDECTFPNLPYSQLCVEAVRALRSGNPEAEVLATYPEHMAHTFVRSGGEACHGLYDLGRTAAKAKKAVAAASLGGPDFPIYFYDCSIQFNYLSGTFNGWGKDACGATEPAANVPQRDAYIANFKKRLDTTLSNQIHPLGVAGRHAKALCLYHARMPGGQSLSATDAWGQPAPLLVACGIFNALTPGGSVGPIALDGVDAYLFSRGENKGHLLAVHMKEGRANVSLALPAALGVRQLDVWGNDVTRGSATGSTATITGEMWSYLTVPAGNNESVAAWLARALGKSEPAAPHWERPERKGTAPRKGGLVLHLTKEDIREQPTLPDSASLALGNEGLTVACWIRPLTNSARWAGFIKKDVAAPGLTVAPTAFRPFIGWNLGTMGSGGKELPFEQNSFRFDVQGPGGGGRVTAGPMSRYAEIGKWTHVAATYNPDPSDRGLRLYVNGVLVADSVLAQLPEWIDNTGPLTISRDFQPFNGIIGDLRIYDRPLKNSAIEALYQSEKPAPEAVTPAPEPWRQPDETQMKPVTATEGDYEIG